MQKEVCCILRGSLGWLDERTGKFSVARKETSAGPLSTYIATIGPTTRDFLVESFGYEPDVCAAKVSNREEFGRWMCEAHNAVNVKLGKEEFDCNRWEQRWRTGWEDGRCD